ncbi:hypothetical protein JXC34_04160 [Candidatus Woesearchaeota archaeon]|nr:hypothetical protein [Candidatus Woesearchaeota archaeon]
MVNLDDKIANLKSILDSTKANFNMTQLPQQVGLSDYAKGELQKVNETLTVIDAGFTQLAKKAAEYQSLFAAKTYTMEDFISAAEAAKKGDNTKYDLLRTKVSQDDAVSKFDLEGTPMGYIEQAEAHILGVSRVIENLDKFLQEGDETQVMMNLSRFDSDNPANGIYNLIAELDYDINKLSGKTEERQTGTAINIQVKGSNSGNITAGDNIVVGNITNSHGVSIGSNISTTAGPKRISEQFDGVSELYIEGGRYANVDFQFGSDETVYVRIVGGGSTFQTEEKLLVSLEDDTSLRVNLPVGMPTVMTGMNALEFTISQYKGDVPDLPLIILRECKHPGYMGRPEYEPLVKIE